MKATDLFGLLVPVTYLLMWGIESLWPARSFPRRQGWWSVGLLFLLLLGTASTVVPLLLPVNWLAAHRLVNGGALGVVGGALVGYFVLSFVNYMWHRNAHRVPLFWRLFHQIHHSPQRVDMPGSVLFHPFEMVAFAAISVVTTTIVLGLDPVAAAVTGYIAAFYGLFQHMNVRTPRWLGYIIQRPESHCVHHQRDIHGFNYSDLPLWDILAGTFRNPASWDGLAGFDDAAAARVGAMLAFEDVNAASYGAKSLGVRQGAEAAPQVA
jgi:sterol desaturase/sphingolipid hydroxylase (fatty acid hydroxylase superfamily)